MSKSTMSRACCALATAVALLGLASPGHAETIRGSVVNGTLGQPQAGCPVSLIAHGTGNNAVARDTTDQAGAFELQAPADTTGMMLFLSATYRGVDYGAPLSAADGLEVFEKTTSDSSIRVLSHHIVVDANVREVTEIVVYNNSGNRTFVTGDEHGHGLEIPLPEGVDALLRADQGVHLHGNVLVDPRPVYPGNGQLAFGFAVPASGDLSQLLPFATDALDILVTPPDASFTAASFQDLGEAAFGQRRFHRYNRTGLAAGERIELRLAGGGGFSSMRVRAALPWLLAALGLIMAGLAIYFSRRGREEAPEGATAAEQDLQTRRQALLRQIADLDDAHTDGTVDDAAYEERRAALKAEVVRITQSLSAS